MLALRDLQSAFGRSVLFDDDTAIADAVVGAGFHPEERLQIYRNTARCAATDALRLTFPAVDELVGGAFFDMAAARFWRQSPPSSGCLADYGGAFPGFLDALPEAASVPYLGDVGRLEWSFSAAATAIDMPPLDVLSLAGVPADQAAQLSFAPHPSVTLLRLAYPADRIVDAVLSADNAAMATIDLADGPVALVVERGRDGLRASRLDASEADFLARLFAGQTLGTLLASSDRDLTPLLAAQFAAGRIVAAMGRPT